MTQDNRDDDILEGLFARARTHPPQASEDLMARVMADAIAAQPAPAKGALRSWIAALGGLPALGGLITATCVGFWLGIAPPAAVPDLAGLILEGEAMVQGGDDGVTMMGFGWDMEEGQADG